MLRKVTLFVTLLISIPFLYSCQRQADVEMEKESEFMKGVALAAPILPGKVDSWREWSRELAEGPRRTEYVALMKKTGVSRIRVWLQESPEGAVAIIVYEGDTPEMFLQEIGSSQTPFAVWFRERVQDLHGFHLAEPAGPPPELVSDFQSD